MVCLALRGLLVAALLAACGAPTGPPPGPVGDAVVVTSFDFAESRLLAEVYAQALEGAGVPVRRELGLGPRELVLPALRQGLVDVVPEYLGTALATVTGAPVDASPDASLDAGTAHRLLAQALEREGLQALTPSPAQNQNGLAVTRSTAEELGLATTSDLAPTAGQLSLTGPAECPERLYCLKGLRSTYGLSFERFVPYDSGSQRFTALQQGVVDVAVVFTTDGLLATEELVLLADDRSLQPVENVLPVVSDRVVDRYGPRVVATLDAVSQRLDSRALTFLNWRVQVAGREVPDEARGWLLRHDLQAG